MNTLAATASDRGHGKAMLRLRTVLAAWRTITRQQVLLTFLLGCTFFLYRAAVTINIHVAPTIFLGTQLHVFVQLLAFVVADRVTGKDPDRRGAYVLGVVIGAGVSVPLSIFMVWGLIQLAATAPIRFPGGIGFALNIYFELLMVGGATVWVILERRRARRSRARLHAAELARIAAEKRSVESDLQAMQARIDPEFLFATLAQVKLRYERDRSAGELLLDALIAYLRAAMPKTRDTSTAKDELELARAYLSIARLRTGDRLAFSIDTVAADVANARMPAMILLPLVDQALSRALVHGHGTGSIRIRAAIAAGGVRLEIVGVGIDFALDAEGVAVADVRGRLTALYGRDAELAIERGDAGESVATLRIPRG